MKKNTHPAYQDVLFIDSASGHRFVCGSTLKTDAKEVFEGIEYPVSYLSISSSSHPFFTGSKQLVDSEGRVERFKKRFDRKPVVAAVDSGEEENGQEASEQGTLHQEKKDGAKAAKPSKPKTAKKR